MLSVLVVEDNVAVRAAIARALDRRGCSVTTATNGLEGLEGVRARSFDVVITDLNMPERGGLWLWQQALYQWAFEQAQQVVRPSLPERDLLAVWN